MVQLDLSVLRMTRATSCILCAAALYMAALGGCALKAPPTHGEVVAQALPAPVRIPGAWQAPAQGGEVGNEWLKLFNDPALQAIVDEAIAHNPDLRAAASQVAIAQQAAVVVGAQLLPSVGVGLGARTLDDQGHGGASSTSAWLGAAWEADVWGRLRAQRAAAEAGAEATAFDYAWARQSLAATTARLWYQAIETGQLLALSGQAVDIYGELLRLVQERRNAGKDSDLDVVDVRAKLEQAQSSVERARQVYGESRRALEILLGRYPAAEIAVAQAYAALPPLTGAGVPAALLERRPDLLAAERAVIAAFRNREAAELALLPDFSLSLGGGRIGDAVLSLLRLNPWLATAAIGVSIPVYEGGALRAKVVIATEQQAQAVARYGAVTLNAFREVENALAAEPLLAAQFPLDQKALNDRLEAVRIATLQYKAGRRDLLWVGQLQSAALQTQADFIKLGSVQRANRVRLVQVLGGSFDVAPATSVGLMETQFRQAVMALENRPCARLERHVNGVCLRQVL
jgi:outer membrane protein, multidrug efflux system